MCGIAGVVDARGLAEADRAGIEAMIETLRHRGPDDRGSKAFGRCVLGQTRLSIIDLAGGHQPLSNEDGSIWITYNGEVYNFPELRVELESKGHQFRTHTDTEVIVHLYEEMGPSCVDRLRGMFAFAVWDEARGRLLLARDRVGIKPLYYHFDGHRLVFGSEIKAILAAPNMPRELRPEALLDYLTLFYVPAPKSMLRQIDKLPAGHVLVFEDGRVTTREYWDLRFDEPSSWSEAELGEEFWRHLSDAVRMRLISDVPLGAFLSGGVDSSSVVAAMAEQSDRPVVTNSIGFEEERFNELPHADRVADRFGTEHHRYVVRPDAVEAVERLAWHYDEPFADHSAVPTYYVSKMARQNVTVALSGDGGDENMAGYRRYRDLEKERRLRSVIPGSVRQGLFAPLARLYPNPDWLPWFLRFRSKLGLLGIATDEEAHYRSMAFEQGDGGRRLLSADVREALRGYDSQEVFRYHYERTTARDPLSRSLYVDIKTYLADDILCKVDRASMAVSLEVRVPILDHVFMEFMAGIPPQWKLRGGEGKYLFKQVVRSRIGQDIVDRPKMGFSMPLSEWFRGPLREMFEDTVLSGSACVRDWLDADQVRGLWRRHLAGGRWLESQLWALLMLELWARRFYRRD
ncbi:MAG: asparagine synthase (glutamine-hydrolyzing) [Phycisphaerae bacterium]|nr:asparagine synthase (glutamine-hydrolyzing) [Phycisphaerae bacterium]